MRYGAYRFRLVFEDAAVLPPFKGSTLRGAFGTALKSVVCALKRETCDACLLRSKCVYARVFEVVPSARGDGLRHSPPHPFILEPPLTEQTEYRPGDPFEFGLKLFGWANDYLPYFVYTVQWMGNIGLGRRLNGQRGRFKLIEAASTSGVLFSAEDGLLCTEGATTELTFEPTIPGDRDHTSLRILLETPLRLKQGNRLHIRAMLPFDVLVRAVLRRISVLWLHFGEGEPDLDYRGLTAHAHEARSDDSVLRWFNWRRYSNRQEREMMMGGLIGEATYFGALAEFVPLLRCCEEVHVGKATTFGLGWIRVIEEAVASE